MASTRPINIFQVRAAELGILAETSSEQDVSIDTLRSAMSGLVAGFAAQQKEYL